MRDIQGLLKKLIFLSSSFFTSPKPAQQSDFITTSLTADDIQSMLLPADSDLNDLATWYRTFKNKSWCQAYDKLILECTGLACWSEKNWNSRADRIQKHVSKGEKNWQKSKSELVVDNMISVDELLWPNALIHNECALKLINNLNELNTCVNSESTEYPSIGLTSTS